MTDGEKVTHDPIRNALQVPDSVATPLEYKRSGFTNMMNKYKPTKNYLQYNIDLFELEKEDKVLLYKLQYKNILVN